MSEPDIQNQEYLRSLAEASAWRTHLLEIDAEDSPDLEAWLQLSPHNQRAWNQVNRSMDLLDGHAADPDMILLRRRALDDARRHWSRAKKDSAPRRHAGPILGGLLAASLLLLGLTLWQGMGDEYSTGFGERRTVLLEDGSRLSLDAGSEVRVHMKKHSRDLEIIRGQARFDVAHDIRRPFSVLADGQRVVAHGTAFNIDLLQHGIQVTLIEGKVAVTTNGLGRGTPKTVELKAGQTLTTDQTGSPEIKDANLDHITAWERGQIIAENIPLADLIAHLNRYVATPVLVDDPVVANMHVSGVFKTEDMPSVLDAITQYLPVVELTDSKGVIHLQKKTANSFTD